MKNSLIALLSLGTALAFVPLASAAEQEYFVEIGTDIPKDKVESEWNTLRGKHKALAKLKLFPKEVIEDGKVASMRLQAGPIAQKTAALKICNKLFAADVPCFVIEGVGEMPPTAMMNMNDSNARVAGDGKLPWLSSKAEVAPAPVVKETSLFSLPWLSDDEKPEQAKEDAKPEAAQEASAGEPKRERKRPAENAEARKEKDETERQIAELKKELDTREAKVQVSEAIRVPLTDDGDGRVAPSGGIAVNELSDLKPAYGVPRSSDGNEETGSKKSGAGWLAVSNFLNEEVATSLWDEVRSANRKHTKGLNAKVQQSDASREAKTTLSIGPFANSEDAYRFCREGLQAKDRGLMCRFAPNDAGMANNQMLTLNTARGDAYNALRAGNAPANTGSPRRRPTQNPGELSPSAGVPGNQYWVQVASASSQMEALKKWDAVKAEHGEVVGGLRSSVSTSATDKSTYVVRVGPIVNNDDAIRVCSQLQKRNVECRVLLYSSGNI